MGLNLWRNYERKRKTFLEDFSRTVTEMGLRWEISRLGYIRACDEEGYEYCPVSAVMMLRKGWRTDIVGFWRRAGIPLLLQWNILSAADNSNQHDRNRQALLRIIREAKEEAKELVAV